MKKNGLRNLLATLVSLVTLLVFCVTPAYALSTADVTITATPEWLSMTNSVDNWTMGSVAEATTYWWSATGAQPASNPFNAGDMLSTISNLGSVLSDVKIHGHNFTAAGGAWALDVDGSPGADNVSIKYGITGENVTTMHYLTLSDVEIVDSIAATVGTMKWCMNLLTGTFTAGSNQTGVVTLNIFKHV